MTFFSVLDTLEPGFTVARLLPVGLQPCLELVVTPKQLATFLVHLRALHPIPSTPLLQERLLFTTEPYIPFTNTPLLLTFYFDKNL